LAFPARIDDRKTREWAIKICVNSDGKNMEVNTSYSDFFVGGAFTPIGYNRLSAETGQNRP